MPLDDRDPGDDHDEAGRDVDAVRRVAAADLDPASADVEVVETHISSLVLAGDRVHKRKKHVRLPFVDLSTPERRERICRREVELNRRFSPDVYLGVEEIVDAAGEVVDHAVLMRRMPPERRFTALIKDHAPEGDVDVSACLRGVARAIAVCHARSPRRDEISATATPDALRRLWRSNLTEIAEHVGRVADPATLGEIGELAEAYVAGRTELLTGRIRDGWIVDGHGDLLAEDIFCLDDGPRILDCLEFDDQLRWGDVLLDVGFLAMDLEHHGRADLAETFLAVYAELSGETHRSSLAHHYIAYRALVRAKVALLKGPDHDPDARTYLDQCRRHLHDGRVHLMVVGGLPGTGKSTLADAVGRTAGFSVVRSDETRKELAGLAASEHRPDAFGQGLYDAETTTATYEMLLARARLLLSHGESVVLDASFSSDRWRSAARDAATECHARYTPVRCEVPADVARERLRRRGGDDASDATAEIADAMADRFDAWDDALTVDTRSGVDEVVAAVLDHARGRRDGGWNGDE